MTGLSDCANNGDFELLGISIGAFTILHVIITIAAIGSGLIVVGGMFASNSLPVTAALFLFTTALASLTGFLFPIHRFTPALGVGIVACVFLAVVLFALYKEHLVGAWRWIYVITAEVGLAQFHRRSPYRRTESIEAKCFSIFATGEPPLILLYAPLPPKVERPYYWATQYYHGVK
jgi:hypothetical protein